MRSGKIEIGLLLLAVAGATIPRVLPAQSTVEFCGRTVSIVGALTRTSVGPIQLSQEFADVRRMCPQARDTLIGPELLPALTIVGGRGRVIVYPDIVPEISSEPRSEYIAAVAVLTPDLRTANGHGVGSTVGQIVGRSRRIVAAYCGDSLSAVRLATMPEVWFDVRPCEGRGMNRRSVSFEDLGLVISEVVVAVIID